MGLIERESSHAELTQWMQGAELGTGCIALVGGEAGIGKTAFLHEFCEAQGGRRVLWGACDALFTPRPLAPLHDVARQTQGALLALMESGTSRDAIFAAALDELERMPPALVVFEDMHWADEATLDLFKFLGRRIHRTHAMLIVTYRDDEIGAQHPLRLVIGDLPRANTRRMSLAALSESAVAQLALQAGHSAQDLHRITGGNPLFVTEVLATAGGAVPDTVRDAVIARAARLSSSARDLAELVCVVPGKTEYWLLEQGAAPDEVAIEGCLRIGMVRHEDGSMAFRHELARRAFEDSLSRQRAQSLHSRVLAVLAAKPGIPAARLAHHAFGARDQAQVLRYTPAAAESAASVGAHRQAVAHYQIALQYADALESEKRALLQERLAFECYLTSQYAEAIDAQRAALETWRTSGQWLKQGNAQRWLACYSWYAGRTEQAMQYIVAAVATLERLPPGPELAMAYCQRADLDMEMHEAADSAIEWAQRAISLADQWANNQILCHSLAVLGTVRLIGGVASGWDDLERSLRLALAGGFEDDIARAYTHLGAMAVSRRDYQSATRYQNEGLAFCEEHDLDNWRLYLLAYNARLKFEQGDWNGASADADSVLRHPRTTLVSRIPALRILGHLRLRRGDPDAEVPLAEARSLGGPMPELQRAGTLAAIHGEAAWLAGDSGGVRRAIEPAYQLVSQRRDPRMKGELAAWLWRVEALSEPPTDIAEPYAQEISGDWRKAASAWQTLGCPYEHATVLACYGSDEDQREALAIFEKLGATPAAKMLRQRMRTQGVRGIPRGLRTSTQRNPLGLTQREAQVLELLSTGLRNAAIAKRLFLSTKTIDHHVSSILTKLGAHSRAEAIAIAHRQTGSGA